MSLVSQVLPRHHKHCDELFIAAEDAVQGGDWSVAKVAYEHFAEQMAAHFAAEEQVLFPAFEAATGMSGGPTQMMRYEHEQMRALLGQLAASCTARDAESYGGVAETLLTLLQQHNMKEENILYPMCDQALADQMEAVSARVGAALGEAYA